MNQTDSIFTNIINHKIPGIFVYEDETCVAIMDKYPEVEGKVLIIPRKQVDYIADLDDETYQHIFLIAKKLSKALDIVFDTERTVMLIEGFEVPHTHIKLYPINKQQVADIANLLHGGSEVANDILSDQAEKIKQHI